MPRVESYLNPQNFSNLCGPNNLGNFFFKSEAICKCIGDIKPLSEKAPRYLLLYSLYQILDMILRQKIKDCNTIITMAMMSS